MDEWKQNAGLGNAASGFYPLNPLNPRSNKPGATPRLSFRMISDSISAGLLRYLRFLGPGAHLSEPFQTAERLAQLEKFGELRRCH